MKLKINFIQKGSAIEKFPYHFWSENLNIIPYGESTKIPLLKLLK